MSPYVICMHCSLYEERWLCDWLFSLFMVEDLAQMSLLGLITLPSVAHAPSHCSTLLRGHQAQSWGLKGSSGE